MTEWLWRIATILAVFVVLVAMTFAHDAWYRRNETVTLKNELYTSLRANVLFVYEPGVVATGSGSSDPVRDTWLHFGDVLVLNYGSGPAHTWQRFFPKAVIKAAVDDITKQLATGRYRRIVFLGSSMGGLLAYDIRNELGNKLDGVTVDAVVLAGPTQRSDFQPPLDKLSLAMNLPFGAWWNKLGLVGKVVINDPKDENIDPSVDRQKLQASVDEAKSFQMSFNRDQVYYIMHHGGPAAGSFNVDHLVFVQSTWDKDTVRPEAVEPWRLALADDGIFTEFFVESPHNAFAEQQPAWIMAFVEIFRDVLGLKPIG